MQLEFTKMQGLGNDFVLVDARLSPFTLDASAIRRLADRRLGVGCDQVLVIETPSDARAAVRYRVFNADGSSAEHCGNGVRCVARYLLARNELAGGEFQAEINGGLYRLITEANGIVRVDMGAPRFEPSAIPIAADARAARYVLEIAGHWREFGAVSMGNPHAVFLTEDVDVAPVEAVGAPLQNHSFFPQRVNVGFMQVLRRDRIRLRVFERGAGETPACGTGACGAVAVGRSWGLLDERVTVELRGGELDIEWSGREGETLWMSGPAVKVFEGRIEL